MSVDNRTTWTAAPRGLQALGSWEGLGPRGIEGISRSMTCTSPGLVVVGGLRAGTRQGA